MKKSHRFPFLWHSTETLTVTRLKKAKKNEVFEAQVYRRLSLVRKDAIFGAEQVSLDQDVQIYEKTPE